MLRFSCHSQGLLQLGSAHLISKLGYVGGPYTHNRAPQDRNPNPGSCECKPGALPHIAYSFISSCCEHMHGERSRISVYAITVESMNFVFDMSGENNSNLPLIIIRFTARANFMADWLDVLSFSQIAPIGHKNINITIQQIQP